MVKIFFILTIGLLLMFESTAQAKTFGVMRVDPVSSADSEKLADRVMELIANQDSRAVAHLMHLPSTYTENHREEDIKGLGSDISFLIGRFGLPKDIKRENEPKTFFTITVGGGDVPYWSSLSPIVTCDIIYSVQFSNIGVGKILIRTFRNPKDSKIEIQSIGFGLPVIRTDAMSEVASVIKDMMQRNGIALPPNIDQILEKKLKPEEHKI